MNPQGQRNETANDARDSNPAMQIREMSQSADDDDAVGNEGVSDSSMMEGNENETDQEEVEQFDVDTTVSPENESIPVGKGLSQNEIQNDHETDPELDNTTQQSDSSGIRKRRHRALEDCTAASTTAAGDGPAEDGDNGIEAKKIESDTTMKNLMGGTLERQEAVVLAVSCRIQETSRRRETDGRQGGGDESNCMEAGYSLLREVKNEEDQKAKEKKLVARQSCIDMGYQDRRVSWAEGKFQREHGGSDDYSAVDLAKYMEERQDDVPDASHDPGPSHDPEPSHDPSTSHDLGPSHVTMATEDGQYKLTAKLTDYGCPNDGSHHVIKLEGLSMDRSHCGCNLKVIGTPSNGP